MRINNVKSLFINRNDMGYNFNDIFFLGYFCCANRNCYIQYSNGLVYYINCTSNNSNSNCIDIDNSIELSQKKISQKETKYLKN